MIVTAREDGKAAFTQHKPMIDNPYIRHTPEYDAWLEGWRGEWWATADWKPKNGNDAP
jgi:hypothetical protein